MEGGRRRGERSAPAESPDGGREGDDNREEEGMEKFYALIANIRAIRDSLRRSQRKRLRKEAAKPVWKPRFEMEDFMHEEEEEDEEEGSGSSAIGASRPPKQRRKKEEREEEGEEGKSHGLDLCLSL
ncbi:unnamed protein product [Musa acuminata subsp. malaccensis]|uniref:(wild Malaysian banana) hypothetical protein n=1 Tax=Musa acuminata subsp. malaccensis TaxID=214687 RepID=A0A804HQK5_MUSAM|nr:PREDICTED: NRR repressor homolog 1-like [Musa acuminata subsp. malaccensis]CAG1858632.1 unnamed protein product [Musa acuminata subsp. malaccensis]